MPTQKEMADLIGTVPLFAGLPKRHLMVVAGSARLRRVARYTKLISQGDKGDSCFVIVEGKAEVTNNTQPVAELERGDVVGELALLDGGERLADVTMTTAGEVLEIRKAGFDALLDRSPEVAREVMTQLASRLRESERRRFA